MTTPGPFYAHSDPLHPGLDSGDMIFYAHSKEGAPPEQWQPLDEHLENVAKLAAEFAKPFGGEAWARLAGLWHDLGKYSKEFQKKLYDENGIECHLETQPGRVIHSAAGGHWAQKVLEGGIERIFCWLIMGHHAGLADYASDQTGGKSLEPKMRNPEASERIFSNVPDGIKQHEVEPFPKPLEKKGDFAFLIRMLFSCLVDADFLDTEAFMDQKRKGLREIPYPSIPDLLSAFDAYMDVLCKNAKSSEINKIRAEVLEQCRKAAEKEPGAFSLTVPTGGGKTLASLAFALRHANAHGKRRVIYVIPYTSIIEQNAEVFRGIPGFEQAVLEHHSNVSQEDESKETRRSRLAAENWDAPLIVTTSVQFFESLYASRTSRCRKLHNIAESVVIFDEAQCLPPAYLRPIVFAIRELQQHYGVTPLLCTATQPVLTKTESFDFKFREGFESVTEIMENPDALSKKLKRVAVQVFNNLLPVGDENLAEAIQQESQSVLCIVNRKEDARTLSQLLPEGQTIHLSTNLCPEHRSQVLTEIRKRLDPKKPQLFVVSTSLVEAGVDLDFPVVYRAQAGLDSIAQAAGRCNREGRLEHLGKTVVFVPEKQPAYVQSPASLADGYLKEEKLPDLFLPDTFQRYFRERFFQLGEKALDEKNIRGVLPRNLDAIYFRTAAEKFQLIDDGWQIPLIVPYGDAPEIVNDLSRWNARSLFRKLQRYTINVPRNILWQLLDQQHARQLPEFPGACFLDTKGLYTELFGFIPPDKMEHYEVETTII